MRVDAVSATARKKIEAAGGSVEIMETSAREKRAGEKREQPPASTAAS